MTPFTSTVILNTLIGIETTPVDKHSTFSKSFSEHRLCTFSDAVQLSATGTALFSQKKKTFQVQKDKFCVQFSLRFFISELFFFPVPAPQKLLGRSARSEGNTTRLRLLDVLCDDAPLAINQGLSVISHPRHRAMSLHQKKKEARCCHAKFCSISSSFAK